MSELDNNNSELSRFQGIATLLSLLASLTILGHAFTWSYVSNYFTAVGAFWIASKLSWAERYSLCDIYLWLSALACLGTVAWLGILKRRSSEIPRYRDIFACLLLFVVALALTLLLSTLSLYDVAERVGRFALAFLCVSLVLTLAWAFSELRSSRQGASLPWMLCASVVLWLVLFFMPRLLAYIAAEHSLSGGGSGLSPVHLAGEAEEWRLLYPTDEWFYVVHFNKQGKADHLRALEPDSVEVVIDDKRPLSRVLRLPFVD